MKIRTEKPEEYNALRDFVREAFRTAKVSDGDEQNFVDRLRTSENYLPELALVAEEQGRIIGHIMLTRYRLDDGTPLLLAAPLSVAQHRRGEGVGTALMRNALTRARENGYGAVVLMGDPDYYLRFGFRQSTEFGIRNTNGLPARHILAIELKTGALKGTDTTITF